MKIKNYAILFLTGTLFMSMFTYGYAYDKDKIEKLPPGYIEMIENIFENQESLRVLDSKETDIKSKFLEDNYEYFLNEDYINIRNYIMDDVSGKFPTKEVSYYLGGTITYGNHFSSFYGTP